MKDTVLFVGMDVHKESISISVLEGDRRDGRPTVTIANDWERPLVLRPFAGPITTADRAPLRRISTIPPSNFSNLSSAAAPISYDRSSAIRYNIISAHNTWAVHAA